MVGLHLFVTQVLISMYLPTADPNYRRLFVVNCYCPPYRDISLSVLKTRAGTIRSAADTIRIRYDTHVHVHDTRFQNQELWISTTQWMF